MDVYRYSIYITYSAQLLFVKGSRHRILMQCRFHRCCSPSFCWVQLRGAVAPSLGVSSFSEKSRRSEENSIEVKTWRQDWGHLSSSFRRHDLTSSLSISFSIFTLYSLASWSSCQWGPLLASRTASRSIRIIQHRSSSILQWMDVLNWKQLWRSASAVSFGPTKLAMLAATSAFSCECWHQKGELAATDLRLKVQGQLFEPRCSRTSVAFCIGIGWRCLPVHQMTMIRTLRWATAATDQKGTHRAQPQLHEVERWRPELPTADQHAGNVAEH